MGYSPHMSQQLQADNIRVDLQTLFTERQLGRIVLLSSILAIQKQRCALGTASVYVRLILSLRTREPRDCREDRDEDDADDEGPPVSCVSYRNLYDRF
jgi:hypothetical protein